MTFEDEFGVKPPIYSGYIGAPLPATYVPFTASNLPERMTRLFVCPNGDFAALFFEFADGTQINLPDPTTDGCCSISYCGSAQYFIPSTGVLLGRFMGVSFSWKNKGGGNYMIERNNWSVWYNDQVAPFAKCSQILVTNTLSPQTLTITLFAAASTATLTFGYTLGPGGTSCSSPGYTMAFIEPTLPAFLTYSSQTFSGSSSSVSDLGIYSITFTTDLYPFDSQETSLQVIVTCAQQAPVIVPTAVSFEIGITSPTLPYSLTTFTQSAQSQSCGVIATMLTTPAVTWI